MSRIYVACLASYNAGRLKGDWIDLDDIDDADDLQAQIAGLIDGEEWAVHDSEDCPKWGEHPSLDQIVEFADFMRDTHMSVGAVLAYMSIGLGDLNECEERYLGEWESNEDFAYRIAAECGGPLADPPPSSGRWDANNALIAQIAELQLHFDLKSYARGIMQSYAEESGFYFDAV